MIDETKVNLVVAVSIVIDLGTLPSFFFKPTRLCVLCFISFVIHMVDFRIWWEY